MDDIQKELEKAKAYKSAGNYEKAAKTYFKVVKGMPDNKRSIDLLLEAYSAAKNTEKPRFIFKYAEAYFTTLVQINETDQTKKYVPGIF